MANQKYKVKEGCRISHDDKQYVSGEILELDPDLVLFHASNIEVVKEEKQRVPPASKSSNAE